MSEIFPEQPPAASGTAPGRAAYEAWVRAEADGVTADAAWDAAAQAAIASVDDWFHYNQAVMAERDEAREQLAAVRERLENLAAGMMMSAETSHPSKKSEIERGCAHAVRAIARDAEAAPAITPAGTEHIGPPS